MKLIISFNIEYSLKQFRVDCNNSFDIGNIPDL